MDFQTIVCDRPGDHGRHAWTERETGNRYECFGTGPLPGFGQPERPGPVSLDDAVNHPKHYTWGPVEVIEITENLGFCLGNVVKYVLRADHKGKPVEDLKKAEFYLKREIKNREEGKPWTRR